MAEDRKGFQINESENGHIQVADEVLAIIAGLAATEVEGVSSMAGGITKDLISRLGMKKLSKGVTVEMGEGGIQIFLSLNISYGYGIPEVSAKVQEKVKLEIENMTGFTVSEINVRIADVDMKSL